MIQVNVQLHHHQIKSLSVTGHAGYDDKGYDLVCAGVSCITTGLWNAIDELCADSCQSIIDDNLIQFEANDFNEQLNTILQTGLIQLQTVSEAYGDYIKIHKTEV